MKCVAVVFDDIKLAHMLFDNQAMLCWAAKSYLSSRLIY